MVISFLVLWSICLSSSLTHFKNGPKYLTMGTPQEFIPFIGSCYIVLFRVAFLFSCRTLFSIFPFRTIRDTRRRPEFVMVETLLQLRPRWRNSASKLVCNRSICSQYWWRSKILPEYFLRGTYVSHWWILYGYPRLSLSLSHTHTYIDLHSPLPSSMPQIMMLDLSSRYLL